VPACGRQGNPLRLLHFVRNDSLRHVTIFKPFSIISLTELFRWRDNSFQKLIILTIFSRILCQYIYFYNGYNFKL
jgi:hypothetical protein